MDDGTRDFVPGNGGFSAVVVAAVHPHPVSRTSRLQGKDVCG